MLVILQWSSANIKSVCSRIIIKDSLPTFLREKKISRSIQKFLHYRCTSCNRQYIANYSRWRTFHVLTVTPSSVNEQGITITACIPSPSSAHDSWLMTCMLLWLWNHDGVCCTLRHIYFSHIFDYPQKSQKQDKRVFTIMVLYLHMVYVHMMPIIKKLEPS